MPVPRKGLATKNLMDGLDNDTQSGGPTVVMNTLTSSLSTPRIPERIEYNGGFHKLTGGWHFAWKPNRNRREMEPRPKKTDSEKYVEDMIYFNKDESPAVLDSVEDLMMVATTIPPPHLLYEQERYFLFPAHHEITWEDPIFQNCGAVKMEIPAIRFFEDRALGAQFWITIVSITTSGALKHKDSNFDIKGLRITRKKAIVVEFWIGRTDISSDGTGGIVSSEQVENEKMIEANDETVTSKDDEAKTKATDDTKTEVKAEETTKGNDETGGVVPEQVENDKLIDANDETVTSKDDEAKTKATDDTKTEVTAEETTTGNDEKMEECTKDKSNDNDAVTRECLNSFMEQIKDVLIEELSDNLRVPDAKFSVQHFHA